jgi:hypothetical protein
MYIEQLPGCCGVAEIHSLGDSDLGKSAMEDFWNCVRDDYADIAVKKEKVLEGISYLFIFNGVVNKGEKYCQKFAEYIKRNKLGSVVCNEETTLNPNHEDHEIRCYIWVVNWKNLIKWAEKNSLSPLGEESAYDDDYNIW